MPLSWALAGGRWAGALAYRWQPKRRATAMGNLLAAFGGERPIEELEAIGRRVYRNLGMSFVELLRTPMTDAAYVEQWITIRGREHLDRAIAQRRGVILLTAHFGNWELTNVTAGLQGYAISVLARQQGFPRLNALLNAYRESKGCRVITKGMGLRSMVRQLRQGGVVGILADQDGGSHGVLAPFFGRLASTARGPVALALKMGCPIVPVFMIRTGGPAHTIWIEPPLALASSEQSESRDDDVRSGVAVYLAVLERYIRQAPDQWLWAHRRWKSSPQRAVVALSDGKQGHRTQVTAVADLVARAWHERVADDQRLREVSGGPWMTPSIVEIRYRSAWHRAGLMLAALLGLARWQPAWRWLRWALTSESRRALERAWASVTVSCGAATGLVNWVWSRSVGARTIHVMRPPWPWARAFDLSIIPSHDRVMADLRTVVTRGALHAIDPAQLTLLAVEQRRQWALGRPIQIGCLIGGDSRGVRLTPQQVAIVLDQLVRAAKRLGADLLVTTSRRTSAEVEQLVERLLDQHEYCPLLVLASRDHGEGYVPGILAAASILVVSGESMSMVSEAAASGKPVLVFEPQWFWPRPKHRRFLHALADEGAVRVIEPEHLGQQVIETLRVSQAVPSVDDRGLVLDALRRWL